jgi:hypothetical protein
VKDGVGHRNRAVNSQIAAQIGNDLFWPMTVRVLPSNNNNNNNNNNRRIIRIIEE